MYLGTNAKIILAAKFFFPSGNSPCDGLTRKYNLSLKICKKNIYNKSILLIIICNIHNNCDIICIYIFVI